MKDVFNSTKNIASIFQRCSLFIYTILLFFSLFTYITPESTLSILEHFHFLDHPFFIWINTHESLCLSITVIYLIYQTFILTLLCISIKYDTSIYWIRLRSMLNTLAMLFAFFLLFWQCLNNLAITQTELFSIFDFYLQSHNVIEMIFIFPSYVLDLLYIFFVIISFFYFPKDSLPMV